MRSENSYLRVVVATGRVWRAEQLSTVLAAIDGITCRLGAAYLLGGVLKQYNAHLGNLRALGLLNQGRPADWSESSEGGETLARMDYVQVINLLQQHGIGVKEGHLFWQLEFEFEDILEIVPKSKRLEIEFVTMGSPGIVSLLQAGLKYPKETKEALSHIWDAWTYPDERKRIKRAAARIAEERARLEREKVKQEQVKTRVMLAQAHLLEKELRSLERPEPAQLDYQQKLDGLRAQLLEAGVANKQLASAIFDPIEQDIAELAKLKCDGLVRGITVDVGEDLLAGDPEHETRCPEDG